MNVLVTGGAGFIGSHLLDYLTGEGAGVTAIDDLSTGRRENIPKGARLIVGDVMTDALFGAAGEKKYDAIVHLAGQTLVARSIASPALDAEANILGTIRVMEAAKKNGIGRVIFASSAACYGDVPEGDLPVSESHPASPMSFYGLSKLAAEKYLALYHDAYGVDFVVLRFANVYGERQGDGGEGGVISIFCRSVAKGEPITIFGDGEQTRDFIHAGDVARAIGAAVGARAANTVYNVSTGGETSLKHLVRLLSEAAGRTILPQYTAGRPGDIYRSSLKNEKVQKGLGWRPVISLRDGISRTYKYFLDAAKAKSG